MQFSKIDPLEIFHKRLCWFKTDQRIKDPSITQITYLKEDSCRVLQK